MAIGVQAPTPHTESPPQYHVKSRNTLDNTMVGWPMQLGLNTSSTRHMYPQHFSTSLQWHQVLERARKQECRGHANVGNMIALISLFCTVQGLYYALNIIAAFDGL